MRATVAFRAVLAGAAICAALAASGVAAQERAPTDPERRATRDQLQLCRAAIFYHLNAPDEDSRVPRAVAEAMLQQINFVMFEMARTAPVATVADAERALGVVEQFFIDFSKTIAETRSRFADVAAREATLSACIPFIWGLTRERIDYLILLRERAIDAPAFPNRLGERLAQ